MLLKSKITDIPNCAGAVAREQLFEVLQRICARDETMDDFLTLALSTEDLYTQGTVRCMGAINSWPYQWAPPTWILDVDPPFPLFFMGAISLDTKSIISQTL